MAQVFEKTGVSIDRMIILDPREALVYPFNLGSDWTELRYALALSATTVDEPNNGQISESLTDVSPKNSIWFGFIGYTGDLNSYNFLPKGPGSQNSSFIGQTNYGRINGSSTSSKMTTSIVNEYYAGIGLQNGENGDGFTGNFFSTSGNRIGKNKLFSTSSLGGIPLPMKTFSSGASGFCCISTIRLIIDSSNRFQLWWQNYRDSAGHSKPTFPTGTPTQSIISKAIADFRLNEDSSSNQIITGYYTHDGTSTGFPEPKPSGILFYTPFFNNRIRIHGLVLERYA